MKRNAVKQLRRVHNAVHQKMRLRRDRKDFSMSGCGISKGASLPASVAAWMAKPGRGVGFGFARSGRRNRYKPFSGGGDLTCGPSGGGQGMSRQEVVVRLTIRPATALRRRVKIPIDSHDAEA